MATEGSLTQLLEEEDSEIEEAEEEEEEEQDPEQTMARERTLGRDYGSARDLSALNKASLAQDAKEKAAARQASKLSQGREKTQAEEQWGMVPRNALATPGTRSTSTRGGLTARPSDRGETPSEGRTLWTRVFLLGCLNCGLDFLHPGLPACCIYFMFHPPQGKKLSAYSFNHTAAKQTCDWKSESQQQVIQWWPSG